MSNEEHMTILRLTLLGENIEIWNEWRKDNPQIFPDLSKEDLRAFSFINANLENTDLSETDLKKVDLSGANLRYADLTGADLQDAYLVVADLKYANLTNANLENVDFMDSDLEKSKLTGANLKNADFIDNYDITSEQIKSAINWEQAKYEFDFKVELGWEWPI